MAINLKDLDGILGYDEANHSVKGIPTLANHLAPQPTLDQLHAPQVNTGAPKPLPNPTDISQTKFTGNAPRGMPTMEPPAMPSGGPPNGLPQLTPGTTDAAPGIPSMAKPPESFGSKVLHGFGKVGAAIGDAIVPGAMQQVPGTRLNKEFEQGREAKLDTEKAKAEEERAVANSWQPMTMAGLNGETFQAPLRQAGQVSAANTHWGAAEADTGTRTQAQKDIAAERNASQEKQTGERIASNEKQTGERVNATTANQEANRENQLNIARMRDNLENVISQRRESTQENIAHEEYGTPDKVLGAAPAGKKEGATGTLPDGTKVVVKGGQLVVPGTAGTRTPGGAAGSLTAPNKGRSEFAKTVVEQIPSINSEIDALSNQIGPGAGRWNEFWVNKGGINDPGFAALDQDLGLFASAVAVTHFGARGGGQHFIEQLKKDFSEAQSPEDLKARIASAQKWLGGYADMGEKK